MVVLASQPFDTSQNWFGGATLLPAALTVVDVAALDDVLSVRAGCVEHRAAAERDRGRAAARIRQAREEVVQDAFGDDASLRGEYVAVHDEVRKQHFPVVA